MFIALDGDLVGRKIEMLILEERVDELFAYNQMVTETILTIETLIRKHGGQVFLSGGDNILAFDPNYQETLNFLYYYNQNSSDLKFSIGYANSIKLSYLALKCAKCSNVFSIVYMYIEGNELKTDYL